MITITVTADVKKDQDAKATQTTEADIRFMSFTYMRPAMLRTVTSTSRQRGYKEKKMIGKYFLKKELTKLANIAIANPDSIDKPIDDLIAKIHWGRIAIFVLQKMLGLLGK